MHKTVRNFYILCVSVPVMLIFIWFFAVKKTMEQGSQLKEMRIKLESLQQAPVKLASMENRLSQIRAVIGNSSENLGSDEIFNTISKYVVGKQNLTIVNFPLNTVFENSNYEVHTYAIKMQGKYLELLKMLNHFEQNKNIGKIVSVDFKVEKNLKTKKKYLVMLMYVQTYNNLNG